MTIEMISLLISVCFFVLYIAYIVIRYGVQPSISDSYYRLTKMNKAIFTVATWGYAFPLIIAAAPLNVVPDGTALLFFAGGLICFVGAAPDFRGIDKGFHSVFAEGGIAFALVWMLLFHYWLIAVIAILAIAYLYWKQLRNHTWWIEVIAYASIVLALLLRNLGLRVF